MRSSGIIDISGIEPGQVYDLTEIVRMKILPFRDMRTWKKIMVRDMWGENLLQAEINGVERGTRYAIKGANLIKFVEKYGMGIQMTAPKLIK